MDNKKDNSYYLKRIIKDLAFVVEHTKEINQEQLEKNEILIDSVMFRLIQIAENSDKLSAEFKGFYNDIPWRAMKGMRNKIVHEYGNVDLAVVYNTIINDIPMLLELLQKIA